MGIYQSPWWESSTSLDVPTPGFAGAPPDGSLAAASGDASLASGPGTLSVGSKSLAAGSMLLVSVARAVSPGSTTGWGPISVIALVMMILCGACDQK